MPSFDVCAAFFAASLLLALAPGPDIIFVITQAALFGARAGIATTLGLITGLCFHTAAVSLGVAVIFQTSRIAFTLLKCLGAGYLCWLAWLSLRAGTAVARGNPEFVGYGALYRRGIVMNVTNPKVALFFLAFLPQFCEPARGPVGLQMLFFGFLFMLAALAVFLCASLLGGRVAKKFNSSPRAQVFMHRAAAVIFLGLALMLAFTGQ